MFKNFHDLDISLLLIVMFWAFLIWLLPLLSGMIAALFMFKNNAALSATTVAGARDSNVAYTDILENCKGKGKQQLEIAFSISYALGGILLTLIPAFLAAIEAFLTWIGGFI